MGTDKKEQIMNAATELFAEKGFEGTSIRDLAAKAGVNLAMINYYFGSKDKLFEAMIEFKAELMRGKLDEIASDPKRTEIEKIDAVIEIYVGRILSQPLFHRVLYQQLLVGQRESMQQTITGIFGKNSKIVKNILLQGMKKKVFKKIDPELTMATLIGTINQVMLSKAMCIMLVDREESFDPYTDVAFRDRLIKHLKQVIHAHLLHH
ncbi:MAG: TetR family transcriptional regulator [Sediminibacterium sp.]